MPRPPGSTPTAAIEAHANICAERAVDDPAKLARAARIFRAALARGLVDIDGNVIEPDGGDDDATP